MAVSVIERREQGIALNKSCTALNPKIIMISNQFKTGLILSLALLMFFNLSCGRAPADTGAGEKMPSTEQETPEHGNSLNPVIPDDETEEEAVLDKPAEPGEEPEDPADKEPGELTTEILKLQPNELGEIMILMYHEIGEPEGEWRRTPENFRRDLKTLYQQGYRATSLTDMVRGEIDIPAGTSPVVLTFDDANQGNFNYIEENGEPVIDPDCAVAIMEAFYEENPDFGLEATFYIYYPNPFRQPQYIENKLNYLVDRGFEIGNHTYSHANLARLSREGVQKELAKHVKSTQAYLPDYPVNSLALTYGIFPQDPDLAVQGSYEGTRYYHEAVLLVGANPAPSPFHKNFNPSRLPRIRASEMNTDGVGLYDWLEVLENNPHRRYISDGDPRTITAPESLEDRLDQERAEERTVRFYENQGDQGTR